jgi:hypothetical protein
MRGASRPRTSSLISATRAFSQNGSGACGFRGRARGNDKERLQGRKSTRGWGLAAVATAIVALAGAAPAPASQDPNPPWPQLLPPRPVTDTTQPGPVPRCHRATMRCIRDTIGRMRKLQARFGCDHRAVFATTYLLLTEQVRDTMRRDRHFFNDRRWLIYEDTVFANYYFRAVNAYSRGKPVPAAWKVAFDSARAGDANAGQDMLLGINAHVQRDMPFVVASVGLRTRAGASRKPDHDVVNAILSDAYERIVSTIGRRYDSLVTITNASWNPIDDIAGLEMVKGWREGVWRNAERLVEAKTASERRQVIDSIETNAATWANLIAGGQVPPGYRAQRDAYCEAGGARAGGAAGYAPLP